MRKVVLLAVIGFSLFFTKSYSQTTIISPTGNGGFESGADFAANGWTVVNGSVTNKWFVGSTAPTGFTGNAAYISNNATGATWAYGNTSVSVVHFYRDVTIAAGQNDVTLSFDWKAQGETGFWDALLVSVAPTSYTPVASATSLAQGTLASPAVTLGGYWLSSASVNSVTIKIPTPLLNNCAAPSTLRLIFTWKNDGSGGDTPPAGIDNISLVSNAITGRIPAAGGTYTINPALPNTGANFTTITEAVTSLNSVCLTGAVTFNIVSNQLFNENVPEITATGTVTAPITFQKNGPGTNPVITPINPGTIAASTTLGTNGDGIVVVNGGDYITFDGIDLQTDPSFTAAGRFEYGYYLKKVSGTDACKNVTIKNCSITLDKANIYSFGIYVSNIVGTSVTTVTAVGGRSENIKIFNNTIANVYGGINVTGFAAATPYDFYDQGIEIGVGGANIITDYGGGATATYGIYATNSNALKIANNSITSAPGTTTTLYGINTVTGVNSNLDIYGNTITLTGAGTTAIVYGISNAIGGTGTSNTVNINNNTITGCTYPTSTSGSLYLIHNTATAYKLNVYNNSMNNNSLSATSSTVATTGTLYGIFQNGAVVNEVKIYNNNISTLDKFAGTTGVVYGIYNTAAATANVEIYSDTITGMALTGTTAIAHGILNAAGLTASIYKNSISGISYTGTTGGAYGIGISGGVTSKVYNNFVSDLLAPTTNGATDGVRGISITSTTATSTILAAFNTIYLNATSSGAAFSSSGIFHTTSATATTAALTLQNNIVVNTSQPNGATGFAAAYRRSSTALTNYAAASNKNLFYAGGSGGNNVLFYDGTNSEEFISGLKTRLSPRESSSITENPPFINASSIPYDLHINTAVGTQVESGGMAVTGITDDYDGNTRNASTPDIGADEFTGIAADLSGPSITYTVLPTTCATGNRTLAGVVIVDFTGVPTTGTLVPRIYYNKNGGTWYSKPGTLVSGTATNSTWDFTIVVTDMGGVIASDIVNYFVIAQDLVTVANIGSSPGGVTATNVNSISTYPTTPSNYYVGANLTGTFTVGAAGNYTTLTAAVTAYNNACLSGPVTFNLIDGSYAGETFPIVINANSFASATNTLTIKPANGVAVVISGTTDVNLTSIIKLDGADYVTINGLNVGGASLTVENTSTTPGTAAVWLSSNGAGLGATNNTIKNLIIKAGIAQNAAITATYGIVVAGNALNTAIASVIAGDDNDNNIIEGNDITKVRYGIFTRGGSTTNPNLGTIIRGNTIGPAAFGADEIGKGGIVAREEDGIKIDSNHIRFVGGDYANTSGGTDRIAIAFATDAAWPAPTSVYVKNATVTRNLIHDIVEERTFAASAVVLAGVDGTNATNNVVANNMAYNILANGTGADHLAVIGINSGKGDKVAFNSIYLTGDCDPNASATATATSGYGISIGVTAVTDLTLKNNNVFMDVASSSAPTLKFAAINIPASYVWGTGGMNNNNWYNNPSNTVANLGSIGTTFYTALAAWQTATTQDANSKSVDPLFTSATDLHLQTASTLDNQGTPVSGITNDFDNDTRNLSIPDIGADEFNNSNCTGAVGGTATATKLTVCSGDSSTISVTGFSLGMGSSYQWQLSTDNSIWNDIIGQANPTALNTSALTATRYYRYKVTCTSGTAIAYSNVITINVTALPTVTVSPTGPISLCTPATQLLSVTATSAASPSYQWQNNGVNVPSATTATYTASTSGNYTARVTSGTTTCTGVSATIIVEINPTPTALTITPSASSLCHTTNPAVLLTADGGSVTKNFSFGTQAAQNTASTTALGYPAPYTVYYGAQRMQMLILASELSASGFSAGDNLRNISFPVVSFGTNWPATTSSCQNFQVSIGATTSTSIAAFQTGLTQVIAPASFIPVVGSGNTHVFSTPFAWDGTSNIVIETTFSNAVAGVTADLVTQYNSPTAFQSCIVYRADNVTAADAAVATAVNFSYSARPDFTLNGARLASFSWSPVTDLFTNAAATTAYTGTATSTVYAKPTVTRTYTATASIGSCTNTQTVTVTNNCSVPVTLLNFRGTKQGSINNLSWTTETEINNAGFELQRSADGSNFSTMAFVASKAANGTSNATLNYSITDAKPFAGNSYYRLKQSDKDGKVTYSQVVLLKGSKLAQIDITAIYPNPVRNVLSLVVTSPATDNVTIIVTDIAGKVLLQKVAGLTAGDNTMQFNVSNLASGTYLIKATCQNGCESSAKKFVKD